jgi:hypothetical protein
MRKSSSILIFDAGDVNIWVMAYAFLKTFDPKSEFFPAANYPQGKIAAEVLEVLKESMLEPENDSLININDFSDNSFEFIFITGAANPSTITSLSRFTAKIIELTPINVVSTKGDDTNSLNSYRELRDEIKNETFKFYREYLRKSNRSN